jgi:hypothetical protein
MNYFSRLFSADSTASVMRLIVVLIVVNALVILNYKIFTNGDISNALGTLVERMLEFAIAGKVGQSIAEQYGNKQ